MKERLKDRGIVHEEMRQGYHKSCIGSLKSCKLT